MTSFIRIQLAIGCFMVGVSIVGCSAPMISTSGTTGSSETRRPASESTLEEIDSKFETYWQGDAITERKEVQDVGRVIGAFVQREAKIHQDWKQEYETLKPKAASRALSKAEAKKYAALKIVVEDLPTGAGSATRDVHRKAHGCFAAHVKMNSDIPRDLQKGLFVPGQNYDAIVRYSNGNPKNQRDFEPDARGMAVKLLDEGVLPRGSLGDAAEMNRRTKLDMLAINFPVFFVNDPKTYTKVNEAFLATNPDPEAFITHKWGEIRSVYLAGMNSWERELAFNVNGSIISDPLVEQYWSMSTYRLGRFSDPDRTAIRFSFVPCARNLPAGGVPAWTLGHDYAKPSGLIFRSIPEKTAKELGSEKNRYYLRNALYTALSEPGASVASAGTAEESPRCFDIQVQRFLDQENTPVEDTTAIWLESAAQRKFWADKFARNVGRLPSPEKELRRGFVLNRKISPPVKIGRIDLLPVSKAETAAVKSGVSANTRACEDLSFNPWNQMPDEHKPLGIVGRMRRAAYAGSSGMRHKINGVTAPAK